MCIRLNNNLLKALLPHPTHSHEMVLASAMSGDEHAFNLFTVEKIILPLLSRATRHPNPSNSPQVLTKRGIDTNLYHTRYWSTPLVRTRENTSPRTSIDMLCVCIIFIRLPMRRATTSTTSIRENLFSDIIFL